MKNIFFQIFSDHCQFFFLITIHKKLNKSCYMDKNILLVKSFLISLKKTPFENSQYMTNFLGFWFRVILNLYGMTFYPVVVLGLEHDFLFKSAATYCAVSIFQTLSNIGWENKNSNIHNFLPDLKIFPLAFIRSVGL